MSREWILREDGAADRAELAILREAVETAEMGLAEENL